MITLPKIKENFKKNFSLSKLTWFQTGGKAEFFYVPSHIEDLKYFLKKVKKIHHRNNEESIQSSCGLFYKQDR